MGAAEEEGALGHTRNHGEAAPQAHGMEPKRLQLVQHGPDKPPSAALVEAVRQGRPGLAVLPTLLNT